MLCMLPFVYIGALIGVIAHLTSKSYTIDSNTLVVCVLVTTSTRHYRLESSKFSSVVITYTVFSQQTSSVCAPPW